MGIVKNKGNVREASCQEELTAMRDSIDILGGKWKLLIMRYLTNRTSENNHFKKIQRGVSGISAKMLSKELKDLELNLMVTRTIQDTRPVTVEYSITEYGKSIIPVTDILVQWGLNHREKIKEEILV
ncbi:DNA-binding HxlR family transcriptional regulator [Pedobacter cryoconitis]|uniref:DNA-binding HxlR family transcriptional regulator n=1 Tax=Pedobacter cryoconitis TaxID=188932 RepID=A0A7W9DZX9_9SPHI|nr:helix-turn-helix domain-containing protein [Pedobacter cryoconitis]MBB5637463.1 DNA-binding HxlR family transcriptional regulator [Pedobacter cryoconitis]